MGVRGPLRRLGAFGDDDDDAADGRSDVTPRSSRRLSPVAVRVGVVVVGVMIAGIVYLSARPTREARPIVVIEGADEVDGLLVSVSHEQCTARAARVRVVDQSDESVTVRADYDVSGDCEEGTKISEIIVDLDAPLGDRVVIVADASSTGAVECLMSGEPAPDRCAAP